MKIKILLFFSLLLHQSGFSQTCIFNAITFSNQSEVDNFSNNYPGCIEILGSVIIDSTIIDLQGLNQLEKINGQLNLVGNLELEDFSGLENVTSIGQLWVTENIALNSF